MALCLLLQRYVASSSSSSSSRAQPAVPVLGDVVALTVDHGVRAESAEEARRVGEWCRALGLVHHTLQLVPLPLETKTSLSQAELRQSRYDLLVGACRRMGLGALLVAHHAGDQAETVLGRAFRGSGLRGLRGMDVRSHKQGMAVLRPLLGVHKDRLAATCAEAGQPAVDDPSNRDTRYDRVRARDGLALLEGGAGGHVALQRAMDSMVGHLGRLAADLEALTGRWLRKHSVVLLPFRVVTLDLSLLLVEHHACVAEAVLGRVVAAVAGVDHYPSAAVLRTAVAGLRQALEGSTLQHKRVSVGPAVVTLTPRKRIAAQGGATGKYMEARVTLARLRSSARVWRVGEGVGGGLVYDNRYALVPHGGREAISARPMTRAEWRAVARECLATLEREKASAAVARSGARDRPFPAALEHMDLPVLVLAASPEAGAGVGTGAEQEEEEEVMPFIAQSNPSRASMKSYSKEGGSQMVWWLL
jgi:tRNA(Ile)-lysidine synthetase-like protein